MKEFIIQMAEEVTIEPREGSKEENRSNQPMAITENTLINAKDSPPKKDATWAVGGIVFGLAVILGVIITIFVMQHTRKNR